MTPYNPETTVAINPTISVNELKFGHLDESLRDEVGTIIRTQYFKPSRTMSYLVEFNVEHKPAMWFLEDELIPVYQK